MNSEFTIEYVALPNGRVPAREFVDSLEDKAAARIDAFIQRFRRRLSKRSRLRLHGPSSYESFGLDFGIVTQDHQRREPLS